MWCDPITGRPGRRPVGIPRNWMPLFGSFRKWRTRRAGGSRRSLECTSSYDIYHLKHGGKSDGYFPNVAMVDTWARFFEDAFSCNRITASGSITTTMFCWYFSFLFSYSSRVPVFIYSLSRVIIPCLFWVIITYHMNYDSGVRPTFVSVPVV